MISSNLEYTVPIGSEHLLIKDLIRRKLLPNTVKVDAVGNFFVKVGAKPATIFAMSITTTFDEKFELYYTNINNKHNNTFVKRLRIMLSMIQDGIDGLYYFFYSTRTSLEGLIKAFETYNLSIYNHFVTFNLVNESIANTAFTSELFKNELLAEFQKNKNAVLYLSDKATIGDKKEIFYAKDFISECVELPIGIYNDQNALRNLYNSYSKINWNYLPKKRITK